MFLQGHLGHGSQPATGSPCNAENASEPPLRWSLRQDQEQVLHLQLLNGVNVQSYGCGTLLKFERGRGISSVIMYCTHSSQEKTFSGWWRQ